MDEPAAAALRRKPRASIRLAADAVADGRAQALFSAGHTGATVMAAHAAFGRLPGVERPALATIIPTRVRPAVLLDSGATVECRPHHLVQFAIMGVGLRAGRAGVCVAARRAAVGRRGGEQGKRADPRGASAVEDRPGALRRQRRGARCLRRPRRRHRLRRVHRERHAESQRGAGRDGRGAAARRALGDVRHPGRAISCRVRPTAGFASGSTTRSTAARRSSASTGCASSATGARRPKPCATPWRWPRVRSRTASFSNLAREVAALPHA